MTDPMAQRIPAALRLGTDRGVDRTADGWLGGTAPMWWSLADADTYRRWFDEADLTITEDRFVPEGDSGHTLLRARPASLAS